MNSQHAFDALDLDDEACLDDVVDAVSGRELDTLIDDRKVNLVLEMQAGLDELVVQARVARALEHTRSERGMHLDCGPDHESARFVGFHNRSAFVSFVPFVLSTRC